MRNRLMRVRRRETLKTLRKLRLREKMLRAYPPMVATGWGPEGPIPTLPGKLYDQPPTISWETSIFKLTRAARRKFFSTAPPSPETGAVPARTPDED
jgi:hypothetical protein